MVAHMEFWSLGDGDRESLAEQMSSGFSERLFQQDWVKIIEKGTPLFNRFYAPTGTGRHTTHIQV